MTGVQEAEISNSVRFNDAIMSPDGRLVGYEINTTAANQTDANSGIFHLLNSIGAPGTAATPFVPRPLEIPVFRRLQRSEQIMVQRRLLLLCSRLTTTGRS